MPGKIIRPKTIFLAFFLAITLGCWTQGAWADDSNPIMVKDIYPGATSGIMGYAPVNLNGIVYFSATDGSPYIYNLWRSDGTSQGTIKLTYSGVKPNQLAVWGNSLYFRGIYPGSGQYELYRYDSISGTFTRLTDDSVDPYGLTVQGNSLYFSGNSGNQRVPWKSDGTVSGTTVLAISGVSYPGNFTVLGDRLYFNGDSAGVNYGRDLWEYDITNGTSARLTVGGVNPLDLTVLSDRLYFCGNSGSGWELWEYDSTSGTSAVLTSGGVNPGYLTALGGNLYFSGFNSGSTSYELWKSDGTMSGTTVLTSGGVCPQYLTVLGGNLYFNGQSYFQELWKSDGTVSGTTVLTNSCLYPYDLTVLGNRLYFNGYSRDADVTWKTELWEYDSASGTSTALTHTSVEPQELVNANNILFFYGTDPAHGTELWKYVPVAVMQPPTADPQTLSLNEDSSLTITLTGSDPYNNPLTYSVVTNPGHGTLSGTAPNLIYIPNPLYHGPDSFTFKVNNGYKDSAPATISLTINHVNHPPVANPQDLILNQGNSYAVTLTGSDPDNDPLTYSILTQPRHGTLTGTAPNLIYTSRRNYTGTDNFTFRVNDGYVDSAPAAVNLAIHANNRPVANPQSLTLIQNTNLLILLTGSDVDNDLLTYQIRTRPSHGTLTGTAPNLTYTPSSNYRGTDSFTFRVNDGHVNSTSATIGLTVIRRNNQTLVANPQSLTLNENTGIPITLTGWDAANNPLTFQIVTAPLYGTLSGTAPNLFYTPNAFFYGLDSLTFLVNNGLVTASATVKFSIKHINNPPFAKNDTITTDMETPVTIPVLANDSDPDGDPLNVSYVSQPSNGTANINSNDTITYTPNPGFGGEDRFFYKITDHHGGTADAKVTVTVRCLPIKIDNFIAQPSTIMYGQTTTLSWNTQYGDIAKINHGLGEVALNGRIEVTPNVIGPTTYVLMVTNDYCQTSLTKSVTVNVNQMSNANVNVSAHLGFDKFDVAPANQMKKWWDSSPYYVTSLYLPGAPNGHVDPILSKRIEGPKWVYDVLQQGWGLIPIWIGLQECTACRNSDVASPGAPNCLPYRRLFSSNSIEQAWLEGVEDASSAVTAMQKLGLSGTIIYKNLENYVSNGPKPTVQAFLSGWCHEVKRQGFQAGIYGNLDPARNDFSQLSPQPDAVWIALASTPHNPKITIWDLKIPGSPPRVLSDSLWPNHQRMHQFLIEQANVTFGSASFDIDDDIIDAPVIGGRGVKEFKYDPSTFVTIPHPDIIQPTFELWPMLYIGINNMNGGTTPPTFINGNNQKGQIMTSCSQPHVNEDNTVEFRSINYLYNNPTTNPIPLDNYMNYSTDMCSINDIGQIIGYLDWLWYGNTEYQYGFVYDRSLNPASAFNIFRYPDDRMMTTASGINDAGQIVGSYTDIQEHVHGFLRKDNNFFGPLDYDSGTKWWTQPYSINGIGQVAGFYQLSQGSQLHGFIYDYGTNSFIRSIDFPDAILTIVTGINNNSQVVGYFQDVNFKWHGFFYNLDNDEPPSQLIDFPGAYATCPLGINDFGQIVGFYYTVEPNARISWKYFIATPKFQ